MKRSALLAGASLVLWSSAAAAEHNAGGTLYFYVDGGTSTKSFTNYGPEAAAIWAYAPPGDPEVNSASNAAASADLTAGTLRVFTNLWSQNPLPYPGASLEAGASFADTVTFTGTPGQINVALSMTIEGAFAESRPLPQGGGGAGSVVFQVSTTTDGGFSSTKTEATISWYILDAGPLVVVIQPPPDGTNVVAVENGDGTLKGPPYSATVTTSVVVPVGSQVAIYAAVFVSTGTTTPGVWETTDFGSTARVSLGYPAGYAFTSESGVFLSRPDAGGLSLDGGMGGPPDLDAGPTTGGSTSSGSTSGGGTSSSSTSSSGTSGNGSSGTGGSGSVSSSGGSTTSGGPGKPSGGCSSVGADDAWAPGLFCAAALARRAARKRGRCPKRG